MWQNNKTINKTKRGSGGKYFITSCMFSNKTVLYLIESTIFKTNFCSNQFNQFNQFSVNVTLIWYICTFTILGDYHWFCLNAVAYRLVNMNRTTCKNPEKMYVWTTNSVKKPLALSLVLIVSWAIIPPPHTRIWRRWCTSVQFWTDGSQVHLHLTSASVAWCFIYCLAKLKFLFDGPL